MRAPSRLLLSALILAPCLSACSFLSSLFPDKQKQYQYSTEIPPLEIPPDLLASTIQGARQPRNGNRPEVPTEESFRRDMDDSAPAVSHLPPVSPASGTGHLKPQEPAATDEDDTVNPVGSGRYVLTEGSDGTPLIEVDEPYPAAWNTVGRAIGRLRLEISDQNRSDGLYYVYFGEHDTPPGEHGLLSEVFNYFRGKPAHGQEYRIKVEDRGKIVYVLVLDDKNQPLNGGEGVTLLKRLHKSLQQLAVRHADDEETP